MHCGMREWNFGMKCSKKGRASGNCVAGSKAAAAAVAPPPKKPESHRWSRIGTGRPPPQHPHQEDHVPPAPGRAGAEVAAAGGAAERMGSSVAAAP